MSGLVPKLVLGETGKVCMQVTLGQWSATQELPEEMAAWDQIKLQTYFNRVVPEMAQELYRLRRQDNRKRRKKALG